jgi:hypothetical protein
MPIVEDIAGFDCADVTCDGKFEKVDETETEAKWRCSRCGLELRGANGRAELWKKMEEIVAGIACKVVNGGVSGTVR